VGDLFPNEGQDVRRSNVAGELIDVKFGFRSVTVRCLVDYRHSHGVRIKWHENGRKLSEATILSGKLEGVFRRWHDNGVLAEEIHMCGGIPDGLARSFYPSGRRKMEARLKNGALVDQKSWNDS